MTSVTSSAHVTAILAAHVPNGEREQIAYDATLEFVIAAVEPYDRHAHATHVTASAIVAGPRGTVLHVHKLSGRWLQPGGHIDPGEMPDVAAIRETLEECGLRCTHPDGGPRLLQVDRHVTSNGHTHLDLCYLLIAGDEDPMAGEGESATVRWFAWPEAAAIADPCLASALTRAQRVLFDFSS